MVLIMMNVIFCQIEEIFFVPIGLPDGITARDIVDGHREKTLNLLWHIIFGFQVMMIKDTLGSGVRTHSLIRTLKVQISESTSFSVVLIAGITFFIPKF